MSISLFGLIVGIAISPALLIAREVVGHDKFDEWLDSDKTKYKAAFTGEREFTSILGKSGYDCTEFLGSYKTHLSRNKDDFFWWEISNKEFIAAFNKNDLRYKDFIAKVEAVAGRKIFTPLTVEKAIDVSENTETTKHNYNTRNNMSNVSTEMNESMSKKVFDTIYSDHDILIETLIDYGVKYKDIDDNNVYVEFEDFSFTFSRNEHTDSFSLTINSMYDDTAVISVLSKLSPEYTRIAQDMAYSKIISKCESNNLYIESEEVTDEGDILLVINV